MRSLIVVLAIALLGNSVVFAENSEMLTNVVSYTVTSPESTVTPLEALSKHMSHTPVNATPQDHLQTIQNSALQFLHWQYLLRLFLGFALAVTYAWLLSWSPRRSLKADPASDIEEGKTLILLGMLGAVVAEITKLSPSMAFVIFGIGSLVRFRTALDDPKLTGKAIMVVVIGLACGMDQWALGGFVTLAAWFLIYWLESHASVRLKIRVGGKQDARAVYGAVTEFLRNNRCRVKAASLCESKRSMVFVALVPAKLPASEMETVLQAKLAKAGDNCDIDVHVY
ncbi:MAG: MgtC/SapB family protein [Verrucomicrobia bacterium]|nr:MgtC/SapB family protein [Verrucomicrobiota bacterium]